ncbi:uncharacterized protein H6S33_012718 [Morchella sextelata]|uniref:uncharacterized protein n=1 Tax=Morchella sextelata TaxID=1174677 RepID=UPI001D057746|nr:uncharacterized protein H6S33_012718 [Morchella sextelata]KAH0609232.1 hypothetical protein H6S33_012718 [Morchella sextelata]
MLQQSPLTRPQMPFTMGVTLSIIAVTGLAGHAFGSWKSRGENTMWLRDFLPEHVPTARILTYGYDSTLHRNLSISGIDDFSTRLLEVVATSRSHEEV